MTINGRLLLLVVATGLFVRVWTANSGTHHRNHPRTTGHDALVSSSLGSTSLGPTKDAVARPVVYRPITTNRPASPSEEVWTSSTCPIPLPSGIQCGTYRVVNNAGRVARLEIAPSVPESRNETSPTISPEFYLTAIAAERWYFIRLELPADAKAVANSPTKLVEQLPENSATIRQETSFHHPCCSNRKFDFTGYGNAEQQEESAGDCFNRPEPPDLPVPR